MILCVGYLFNENSSLYIFGHQHEKPGIHKTTGDTVALTQEEQMILKSLQDKAAKVKVDAEKPIELAKYSGADTHSQYKNIIRKLWKDVW